MANTDFAETEVDSRRLRHERDCQRARRRHGGPGPAPHLLVLEPLSGASAHWCRGRRVEPERHVRRDRQYRRASRLFPGRRRRLLFRHRANTPAGELRELVGPPLHVERGRQQQHLARFAPRRPNRNDGAVLSRALRGAFPNRLAPERSGRIRIRSVVDADAEAVDQFPAEPAGHGTQQHGDNR